MSRELVEILMIQYQTGDKEYSDLLADIPLFDVPYEDVTEELPEVVATRREKEAKEAEAVTEGWVIVGPYPSLANEPDLIFTAPCTGFDFRFVGQSFDFGYSGGIECRYAEFSAADTFDGWQDTLKKLGEQIRGDKVGQGLVKAKESKAVRFVTLWEYNAWEDSYNHEWDSEWYLLGLVNLATLPYQPFEE